MAISFVGSAEGSSSPNTDTTITLSGISMLQDDLVIVAQAIGDNDNTALNLTMVSTGWTELFTDIDKTGVTQDVYLGVWYKFMSATPDSSAVVDGLGGTDAASAAVAMVFRGVDLTTPFDVTTTTATGTATMHPNPPSVNHLNPAGLWTVIVGASGHLLAGAGTYTFPTGYTTNAIDRGHDDTSDVTVGMGYRSSGISDPEDPGTMTHSGTDSANYSWIAATMALRPLSIQTFFQTLSAIQVAAVTLLTVSTFLKTLSATQLASSSLSRIITYAKILSATQLVTALDDIQRKATYLRTLSATQLATGTLTAVRVVLQTLSAAATAVGTLTAVILQLVSMSATALTSTTLSTALTFARTLSSSAVAAGTLTAAKITIQALSATAEALGNMTRKIGQLVKGAATILNVSTGDVMGKIKDKIYLPF